MREKTIPIIVNTDFDLQTNEAIKSLLLEYIKLILEHTPMDLTRLDRIIASQYFNHELEHLSMFTNYKITYTDNENSKAVAKCITLKDKTEFIDILVLSDIYLGILLKDQQKAFNILHHELIHILDNHNKDEVLYHFQREKVSDLHLHSLPTVLTAWAEFYANYSSSSTLNQDILEDTVENFRINLVTVEENIIQKRELYRTHQIDLNTFLEEYFHVYANSLYLAAAYTIGHCHGSKQSLETINLKVYELLQGHIFFETFIEMEDILLNMLNKYPKLWDETIYDSLHENLLKFYKKLGVSFREVLDENGEVRVRVDIFQP